jgi:hypothetical protein
MIDMHTNGRSLRGAALALGLVALAGCVGVKLTADGAQVRQAQPNEVGNCEVVGRVTSTIPSKTLNKLAPGKVQEQLIVLARNEAPGFGGNTIVAAGPINQGQQEFNVFRCR